MIVYGALASTFKLDVVMAGQLAVLLNHVHQGHLQSISMVQELGAMYQLDALAGS